MQGVAESDTARERLNKRASLPPVNYPAFRGVCCFTLPAVNLAHDRGCDAASPRHIYIYIYAGVRYIYGGSKPFKRCTGRYLF